MEWFESIKNAITFMEDNLTEELSVEDVSNHVFTSNSHFQRIFYLVTGITIGEYIRNRRLSQAGKDLLLTEQKVIDVAMKYQYDTSESFSKAFSRFHGVNPSEVKKHEDQLKYFRPLTVQISINGGYGMGHKLMNEFYWSNVTDPAAENLSAEEKYKIVTDWALGARQQNPEVFDSLTEWILDDSEWTEDKLAENEQILVQGVFARFKEQNRKLAAYLTELRPSGVVNEAVFEAIKRFDNELEGNIPNPELRDIVKQVFDDFTIMKDKSIREKIAGEKTGPEGVNGVKYFGFINCLKDSDAGVQWTLFMPEAVKAQQNGFRVASFEYRKMPAMRFIGFEGEEYVDVNKRMEKMKVLDSLSSYNTELKFDVFFMHHYGINVDIGPWHGVFGRFMKPDTPVPEGFVSIEFVPNNNQLDGPPYISQFAYATFEGDMDAMHKRDGFDSDAMYDVTRNIMLAQGVCIPYPKKYWCAEVFPDGCDKQSTAYMFSAEL